VLRRVQGGKRAQRIQEADFVISTGKFQSLPPDLRKRAIELEACISTFGDGGIVDHWSPDGTRIAFFSNRDGLNKGNVYVMNADGSNLIRLTDSLYTDRDPAWSPDGAKIAFASQRDGGNPEIYVMNADGSNPIRLTFDATSGGDSPAWSPDGSKIAFHSFRDEIYVMNADGSNQTRLTRNEGYNAFPTWSPDGTMIAFRSDRDGTGEIYIMNADGSNQVNITHNPAIDTWPDWGPPGS